MAEVVDLNDGNPVACKFEDTVNSRIITSFYQGKNRVGFSESTVIRRDQSAGQKTGKHPLEGLSMIYCDCVETQIIKEFFWCKTI